MAHRTPGIWTLVLCVTVCGTGTIFTSASTLTHAPDSDTTHSPLLSALRDATPDSPISGEAQGNRHEMRKKASDLKQCVRTNTSDKLTGLQGVAKTSTTAATFYVRPRSSFRKLVFRMKVDHALGLRDNFYADEEIDLLPSDLWPAEEWHQVSVRYFDRSVRGPNKHSLRVTAGNTTAELTSDFSWLMYHYKGFGIFVEGGAEFLFHCLPPPPEVLRVGNARLASEVRGGERSAGVWLMVGLLTVATLLLVSLLGVWFSLRVQNKKREKKQRESLQSPIYEEFDEEVLRNIQKKTEALRDGKSDVCVVTYDAQKTVNKYDKKDTKATENHYEDPRTLMEARRKEVDLTDHIYEELEVFVEKGKEEGKAGDERYQNVYYAKGGS